MGFLDRFSRKKESASTLAPRSAAELENEVIDIARRIVPSSEQLEHHFVVSGNRSLIDGFHRVFRVGAPMYGGREHVYQADASTLKARQADAKSRSLPFSGQSRMGGRAEPVATLAEVLNVMRFESPSGRVFVAYLGVGPKGHGWVEEAYSTILGQAMQQGILPFRMFSTSNDEAAQYLIQSFAAPLAA